MVKYECKLCNYTSINKNNYKVHNSTNKHLKKVSLITICDDGINNSASQNIPKHPKINKNAKINEVTKNEIICEYCKICFSRTSSMIKHRNVCYDKKTKEKEFENEIKNLTIRLEQSEKESKYFQAENNYHKQMLNEAGGLVKKSVSVLKHIVHNYGSAPTIKTLNIDDIENMENNNKKLVEDIVSYYKHKTLDKYLGNSIIKLYKKENPKDQSVWSTDTSRLTYLIKELMINNSSNWIIDKKGIKTKEYLIDPLLEHIKTIVISYQKNNISLGTNLVEMEHASEINQRILKLVMDIDDGIIGNGLLKYISTHLFFNDKLLK